MFSLLISKINKKSILNIIFFLVFTILSIIFLKNYHFTNENLPSRNGDDAAYFNTAFNIDRFNIASHQVEEFRVYTHKNVIKPPFYSFLLSIFINTDKKYENVTLECIYNKPIKDICFEFVQNSKSFNLIIHYIHVLVLYLVIFKITKNYSLSFLGSFLLLSSTYFLKTTNDFMTESLSTILMLIHSSCIYFLFTSERFKYFYVIVSSISLGCLILTKAIFLYWFYFIIMIYFFFIVFRKIFIFKKRNPPNFIYFFNIRYLFIKVIIILVLLVPWQTRNFLEAGEFKISLQGGNVIAERAEYLKTDMNDIKYGIIYYIPSESLRHLFKNELKKKSFMFDEGHPNSHYRNSDDFEKSFVLSKLNWEDKNNPDKVFEKSLELILIEPVKHLYLSLMFYVRSIFHGTIISEYPKFLQYTSSIIHWSSSIALPLIFLFTLISKNKILILTIPSIFIILCYSFFTDFESRYGTVTISSFILIFMILINNMLYKIKNE